MSKMSNASIRGLKCPGCGESFSARAIMDSGSHGSYFHPGDPPELIEVEEVDRECADGCTVTDEELKDVAAENGEVEFDDDYGEYEPSFDYLEDDE